MMKVIQNFSGVIIANSWKKLKINKGVVANCEIMADRVETDKESGYWTRCVTFLNSIEGVQYHFLSKNQKDWALKIKLDLVGEGF